MNIEKLKQLETEFLRRYPLGFDDPELMAVAKKHKVEEMKNYVHDHFSKDNFNDPSAISRAFTKLIEKSSLVSTFEKVKYKNAAKLFNQDDIEMLSSALWDILYGDQRNGFNQLVLLLATFDLAKWPILTVLGLYYNGDFEVLVKPTTVKSVLNYLEVMDIKYTSKPNYDFYLQYRTLINDLKARTGKSIATDNGAYCGFLMITIE
ncbi:MAG TPA: hypothetical protein VLS94_04250 [Fusibacter sp.]|nr:hypothetical protein [Fusibacter sp.]